MKDRDGKTLLFGSRVTCTEDIRPKRRIGVFGTVVQYGTTNVEVELDNFEGRVWIPPIQLIVGEHDIVNPTNDHIIFGVELLLERAVHEGIISKEQSNKLMTLLLRK